MPLDHQGVAITARTQGTLNGTLSAAAGATALPPSSSLDQTNRAGSCLLALVANRAEQRPGRYPLIQWGQAGG